MMALSSLADQIDDLILRTVKKAEKVSKYGGTLYTLKPEEKEGQFCGVFIYKEHVQLVFSQGAILDDPSKVLEGKGKLRRHINMQTADQLPEKAVVKLLKQAARESLNS